MTEHFQVEQGDVYRNVSIAEIDSGIPTSRVIECVVLSHGCAIDKKRSQGVLVAEVRDSSCIDSSKWKQIRQGKVWNAVALGATSRSAFVDLERIYLVPKESLVELERDSTPADPAEEGRYLAFALFRFLVRQKAEPTQKRSTEGFADLTDKWKSDVGDEDSWEQVVDHHAYREIISMGWKAVPLILADLRDNGPSNWFPALTEITGEALEHSDIAPSKMRQDWLRWASEHFFLPERKDDF